MLHGVRVRVPPSAPHLFVIFLRPPVGGFSYWNRLLFEPAEIANGFSVRGPVKLEMNFEVALELISTLTPY